MGSSLEVAGRLDIHRTGSFRTAAALPQQGGWPADHICQLLQEEADHNISSCINPSQNLIIGVIPTIEVLLHAVLLQPLLMLLLLRGVLFKDHASKVQVILMNRGGLEGRMVTLIKILGLDNEELSMVNLFHQHWLLKVMGQDMAQSDV